MRKVSRRTYFGSSHTVPNNFVWNVLMIAFRIELLILSRQRPTRLVLPIRTPTHGTQVLVVAAVVRYHKFNELEYFLYLGG
jgi:hypothetical protein